MNHRRRWTHRDRWRGDVGSVAYGVCTVLAFWLLASGIIGLVLWGPW